MIFHIAGRELRSLFLSPLAWNILAVIQFILAWVFFVLIQDFFDQQPQLVAMNAPWGVSDLITEPMFRIFSILLIPVCAIMSMRLLSEERRSGTLKLLLSSPISMSEIVLGKYIGIMAFFFVMIALLSLMQLSLLMGTSLDIGKFMAGLLGVLLLTAAFCAVGLYMSSVTQNQMIAAISTFGLLILLSVIDAAAPLKYLSVMSHNTTILHGKVNSSDVIYYVLLIILFISLSIRQLDNQRLQR